MRKVKNMNKIVLSLVSLLMFVGCDNNPIGYEPTNTTPPPINPDVTFEINSYFAGNTFCKSFYTDSTFTTGLCTNWSHHIFPVEPGETYNWVLYSCDECNNSYPNFAIRSLSFSF